MNILDDLKDKVSQKRDIKIHGYDFTIRKLPIDVVLDLDLDEDNVRLTGNQLKMIVINGVSEPKLEIDDVNKMFEHKLKVGLKLVEEIMEFYGEELEDIKKK